MIIDFEVVQGARNNAYKTGSCFYLAVFIRRERMRSSVGHSVLKRHPSVEIKEKLF
jgi:hypothetical protein